MEKFRTAGSDLGTNHITWGTLNQSGWIGSHRGGEESVDQRRVRLWTVRLQLRLRATQRLLPRCIVAYNLPDLRRRHVELVWRSAGFPAGGSERCIALGWNGYSLGFTDFAVQPVIGTYRLYAAVPPAYDTPQNPTPSPNPNGTPTPAARDTRSRSAAQLA